MQHYDACLQSKRWNLVRSVAAFQRRRPASLVATCDTAYVRRFAPADTGSHQSALPQNPRTAIWT